MRDSLSGHLHFDDDAQVSRAAENARYGRRETVPNVSYRLLVELDEHQGSLWAMRGPRPCGRAVRANSQAYSDRALAA